MSISPTRLNNQIDQLQAKIKKLQEKEIIISSWEEISRPISSFTDEEKCKIFDRLYNTCHIHVQTLIKDGYDKDFDHYIYEDIMTLTHGKDIFKVVNAALS